MAETIHIRGEGGGIHAMDLPLHESVQQRLARGQLTRVNPDGSTYTGLDQDTVAAPPTARPGKNAPKAQWTGWAVAVHGMTPDNAEAMTKGDLMDLPEQPATPPPLGGAPSEEADKAEWIAYAVGQGHLSADDAANLTKADLIDLAT